jgi:uncharacterized integral membrane protein
METFDKVLIVICILLAIAYFTSWGSALPLDLGDNSSFLP